MVRTLKTYTVTIPPDTYKRLQSLSLAQQRPPTEILTLALNLLTVALPRASQIAPAPFKLPPRRSARTAKP